MMLLIHIRWHTELEREAKAQLLLESAKPLLLSSTAKKENGQTTAILVFNVMNKLYQPLMFEGI